MPLPGTGPASQLSVIGNEETLNPHPNFQGNDKDKVALGSSCATPSYSKTVRMEQRAGAQGVLLLLHATSLFPSHSGN